MLSTRTCIHSIDRLDHCFQCEKDTRILEEKTGVMTSVGIRKIYKIKHIKNCRALAHVEEGTWNSPWVVPVSCYLDINAGCKGRTTNWVRFICNDPGCKARLYVSEEDLLRAIDETNY